MIKVTNGGDWFVIPDNKLWNNKKRGKALITKLKYEYWGTELRFIFEENNKYQKIIKTYRDGETILKEYTNLTVSCLNEITLNIDDYNEVKSIYANMQTDKDYKKEALIKSCAILFSYECYQNYILEVDMTVNVEYIFNDFIGVTSTLYKNYKKEIFEEAKKILKQEYKVNLDDKLSNGGNCNE